jgi:hypothetical protein
MPLAHVKCKISDDIEFQHQSNLALRFLVLAYLCSSQGISCRYKMVSPETGQYTALPSEDSGSHIRREKNEIFQEAVLCEQRSNPWFLLCVLSWIVFGGIAVLFTWSYTSRASPTDSYEHGWKTDFGTFHLLHVVVARN